MLWALWALALFFALLLLVRQTVLLVWGLIKLAFMVVAWIALAISAVVLGMTVAMQWLAGRKQEPEVEILPPASDRTLLS
jgi:hypothetical protein